MPQLVILLAFIGLIVTIVLLANPVGPKRVAGFAARHGLVPAPADGARIRAYLAATRRWRIAGVVAGFLISNADALDDHRVSAELIPLVAGWFVGALCAEAFHHAPGSAPGRAGRWPVPRWITRVPLVIALAAGASTAIMVAVVHADPLSKAGDTGPVLGWGAAALVVTAVTAAMNGVIAARGGSASDDRTAADDLSASADDDAGGGGGGDDRNALGDRRASGDTATTGGVDRAIRSSGVGAVTAGGAALALYLLLRQVGIPGAHTMDAVALAYAGLGAVWALAGIPVIAGIIVWSSRGPRHPRSARWSRSHPAAWLAGVVALLVAVSGVWAGSAWWTDHPPYGPAALHASVTLRMTDLEHFDRDAAALGATGLTGILTDPGGSQFIGRIDLTVPPGAPADGTYYVIVIDKQTNTVAAISDRNGSGWDGFLTRVPIRYPWLSAMAQAESGVSARPRNDPGEISIQADATVATFGGYLSDAAGVTADDLLVALIFIGPDQQLYWATRVAG